MFFSRGLGRSTPVGYLEVLVKKFRISKTVIALGVVSLLNDAASEMILPLLPAFIVMLPGGGAALLGLMEGLAESVSAVLKLVSGWASDRSRRRGPWLLAGYGLAVVARPIMGLATGAWHVVGLRLADRVGKGIRTAPRDAMIASATEEKSRGLAYGFHRAMDHTGAVLGPLAALALLSLAGMEVRTVFLLAAVPGALVMVALAAALVARRKARASEDSRLPEPVEGKPRLSLAGLGTPMKVYLLAMLLFTLGNSSDVFLLLRAADAGVKLEHLPALWIVLHLAKIALSMGAGGLSDRVGRRKVILAGWLVYAVVYVLFGFASETWHIWALFTVYGLHHGLTEGAERALVADLVPERRRGTAFGTFHFAVAIGALPSSIAMGVLYQAVSPLVAFCTGAALACAACVVLFFVKVKR
jgi:MFS family permease